MRATAPGNEVRSLRRPRSRGSHFPSPGSEFRSVPARWRSGSSSAGLRRGHRSRCGAGAGAARAGAGVAAGAAAGVEAATDELLAVRVLLWLAVPPALGDGPAATGTSTGRWTITMTCFGGGAVVAGVRGWLTAATCGGADSVSVAMRLNNAVALSPATTIRLVPAGWRRRFFRRRVARRGERRGPAGEIGVSHRRGRGRWSAIRYRCARRRRARSHRGGRHQQRSSAANRRAGRRLGRREAVADFASLVGDGSRAAPGCWPWTRSRSPTPRWRFRHRAPVRGPDRRRTPCGSRCAPDWVASIGLSLPTLGLLSFRPNRPMLEPSATNAAEAVREIAPTVARVFRRSMVSVPSVASGSCHRRDRWAKRRLRKVQDSAQDSEGGAMGTGCNCARVFPCAC